MSLDYATKEYSNPVTDVINDQLRQLDSVAEMAIESGFTEPLRRKLERIVTAIDAAGKSANGAVKAIDSAEAEHALQMSIVHGCLTELRKYKLTEARHKALGHALKYVRSQMLRRPVVHPFQLSLELDA